ncbi:hypothetical protein E3N88_45514 [Mikania micrantha]|uniref:URB1 C-terminal domain-containing protein n=1 Tax=Mikania micrantha TaxID=192012 RepID=A0A5N6L906_9ASTR|nr:hypothetical protein E3N88_45514 [Mikania micrantha]
MISSVNAGLSFDFLDSQPGLPPSFKSFELLDSLFSALCQRSKASKINECKWVSLKQDIQNEVQLLLPDHQVLLSLISSLNSRYKSDEKFLKRNAEDNVNEPDNLDDNSVLIIELWKSQESNNINMRTMPSVLEGSFDFFKVLPSNALSLPTILQQSSLSLLVEHIGWSSKQDVVIRYPPQMYKHLMNFINLVVHSPVKEIKDQAYMLAQAAMLSSGAFDNNATEISAWFYFFLVGNNLFKYWDLVRSQIHHLETHKDLYRKFSPLFLCALEKCIRLLSSDSGTFSLPEKSMISIYVSSTLQYLLQTQVEAGLLSSLICLPLSERLKNINSDLCEWKPLKSLLHFSSSITDKEIIMFSSVDIKTSLHDDSFVNLLNEVTSLVESEHDAEIKAAFSLSMLCASPDLLLQHFPAVITISHKLNGVPFPILLSMCFREINFLNNICKSWPEFTFAGLAQDDFSSMDSMNSSEAFSYFLKQAPFYVLLPAIVNIESPHFSESSKLQELLLDKLLNEISDNLFALSVMYSSGFITYDLPTVINRNRCYREPLSVNKELNANILDQPTDKFLDLALQGVHVIDYHILLEVDVALFEKVYFHIVEITSYSDLDVADLCLLKAVKIASKCSGKSQTSQSLQNHVAMSCIVASTPMSFLSNCFQRKSMIKTQILFHLTESSLLHLSFFAYPFMEIVNKPLVGNCDEELAILFLPTALSFLNLISMRHGKKCDKHVGSICSLYWKILFNRFSNWKSFVSKDIFRIKLDKAMPSTVEEVFDVFNNSLLGKSLDVMKRHLVFEDPETLDMLRVILTFEEKDKSLHIQILQLLLAHSQFAPTIQYADNSSSSLQFGAQMGSVSFEEDFGINARELLFLLLSSYGATVSEKDLEIYKIMQLLESVDESSSSYIAEMDYLWGTAAIRVRKVRETEEDVSSDDVDEAKKHRKSRFRENLPVDPKKCVATVLHFPYDRRINSGSLSSNMLPDDNAGYMSETNQKRKEANRIRPLLTHVQNGISEAWQRIPSLHALFAAEASIILLDPSNANYKLISKILLHSPMKTKTISFFDEFFWSNSVNFKLDRIWILRLLYSGLNSEDDALIYVRSSFLEKLLSFYSCPLSENESRELILQIVKKSMKFDKTSRYLTEHCGVISWLSSLISNFSGSNKQCHHLKKHNPVVRSTFCRAAYANFIFGINFFNFNVSQQKDVLQPHFNISVEGLFELSQAIDKNCNAESVLKVVLMSTPQPTLLTMDQEKLKKFVLWAVSIALESKGSDEQASESLKSKLLRWCITVKGSTLTSLLSKIHCPPEANHLWRWSFDEPWTDPLTKSCSVDELQACQSVLAMVSHVLGEKSSLSHFLSSDLENLGVFKWERSLVSETLKCEDL